MSVPFSSEAESALVTALEFIRVALERCPKMTTKILEEMDLSDAGFDDDMDVLENLLAAASGHEERIVPRLTIAGAEEEED
jgi:hypothetical protein